MAKRQLKTTILQTTKTGAFVAAYAGTSLAAEKSGIAYTTIRHAVRGRKTRKASFKEQNRQAIHNAARGKMRVTQRDEHGIIIGVFASVEIAAEMNEISTKMVRNRLNTKSLKNGFSFNG